MMATVPHVTSGLGLRKFQADGFLLTRVYLYRKNMETPVYELLEVGDNIPSTPIRQTISLDRDGNVTDAHTSAQIAYSNWGRRKTKMFCVTFEVLAAVLKMGSLLELYAVSTGKQ